MRRATIVIALFASLIGCSDGGLQPGNVELQLTGADNYQLFSLPSQPQTEPGNYGIVSAVVIVDEIDAKVAGAWVPLVTTQAPIDLLKLDNQTITSLGIGTLPQGHVSELRLKLDEIGDYVVLKDGSKKPLEVPVNGIVDVDGKLDLDACAAGIVILDFDPKIKVEDEPGRREYELLCSARIKTEELKNGCGTPDGGGGNGGGGGGGNGGGNGGGGGGNGGGTCGDMAGAGCSNVVCRIGQVCIFDNATCMPTCMDTCSSLVCTPPDVCVVDNGTPKCEVPGSSH